MSNTIADLRIAVNNELDSQAAILGENTALSTTQKLTVSYSVDSKNETWNPDLGPRPKS